ncbi:MAG: NAD(P)H-dependent oxidoreductase [Candidatus Nomurabacteria bacterium]|jgi:chromate reductase|nr:NAD(P)H-dependent oxidoreductase [Candidatus Nomurabacteria bacterium]
MKITVIVGSLRRDSLNKKLAKNLVALAEGKAEFEYLSINLPLFNEDLEPTFPDAAKVLKSSIEAADGVLITTPEYNRGMPGALKNAVDWVSRPDGNNSWRGKPVAIAGATPGLVGTALAQDHLRGILSFLNARIMVTPELYLSGADKMFDTNGEVDATERAYFKSFINSFLDFVQDNA